jgi:adenosylhomocysteinase
MIVRVTECDPICAMQACMDGYEVVSPFINGVNDGTDACINTDLLGQTDVLCSATGNVDVCNAAMLRALKVGAVVCNIGHFDNEIDTAYMRENWEWEEIKPQVHKVIRDHDSNDYLLLLAEGRLVNLGNATGHPSRIMDGSFANQVLAQIHLYAKRFADLSAEQKPAAISVDVLPKYLDEQVAALMVEGFAGVMTKLTSQQGDYIGVDVDGPFKNDSYKY